MFISMHRSASLTLSLSFSFFIGSGVFASEQTSYSSGVDTSATSGVQDSASPTPPDLRSGGIGGQQGHVVEKPAERASIEPLPAVKPVADDVGNPNAIVDSGSKSAAPFSDSSKPSSIFGAGTSGKLISDASVPSATAADVKQGAFTRPKSLGHFLKSNIVETFQLDPRLKKDLTEGRYDLRPIKLQQDYLSIGYNPTINWDRTAGPPWVTSYGKTNMSIYAVGPITKHLSMWVQGLPIVNTPGFFSHFELLQGMANYGTDKSTVQFLGGQGFGWQNIGFGGADRTITQTSPGVYTAINGFDPTAPAKIISLSASGMNWTTGKVFGYWQPGAQTSSDSNITYQRGYGVGLSGEKLFAKSGMDISGIQTNLTMGTTPLFNVNTNAAGNLIGRQNSPFIWWTSWINKSFQDKEGYVRLNPSFGLTTFHQRRNFDDPNISTYPTSGYGYTFDIVAIPVRSYLTNILRFDQFRTNGLTHDNTTYTFSAGQAYDFHTPNKGRLRVTFDYQLIGQHATAPSQRLILGFWPIW
jgi:hypothetical protein